MSSRARRRKDTKVRISDGPDHQLPVQSAKAQAIGYRSSLFQSIFSGWSLWIALALIALSVFIYSRVGMHNFVAWDDPNYVSENRHVTGGLTAHGIGWALTTGHGGYWIPLTWLSYMLTVELFGTAAGPQLLINAVLHILNALLLFGLFHAMTGARGRSAFVAALFAAHPLHVESVAWVTERKDVLSTLFGLLALWTYFQFTVRRSPYRYVATLLFFALSLMAKPMLLTLPFVMLLLDYWPLRRLPPAAEAPLPRALMPLVREKLPMFAMVLASAMITFLTQKGVGAVSVNMPLDARLANALVSYWAYIGKCFWPLSLSAFYPWTNQLSVPMAIGSGVLLVAVSILVIRVAPALPYLAVGWFWYLGTLVPVIGLIQVGSQAMADRFTYFPLTGLFLIVAWGGADIFAHVHQRKILLPAAAGIVILGCAVTARAQVDTWRDTIALWTHALDVNERNGLAQYMLGEALLKQGNFEEAIPHYAMALRVRPENAEAHDSMGKALVQQGKITEAIAQYAEAIRLNPAYAEAYNNLGIALASQGSTNDAIANYLEALKIDPEFASAHDNLGIAYATQGESAEANAQFSQILRLDPDNPYAHENLGILMANQGRVAESIEHFSAAVRIKPDFEAAQKNLEAALARQKATTEGR